MTFKAIIIDDESAAISYLKSLIDEYVSEVEVVATASNALEGIKRLNEQSIDIIFLDIEMPGGTGFDLVEAINSANYKIVFTTAYEDFALDAFKIKADGYLLKPIDIDDLEELVAKFLRDSPKNQNNPKRLAFRTQESIEYVKSEDIIRAESEGNYTTIYLKENKKIVVSKNMKQIEQILTQPYFIKTHKSFIVNSHFILRYLKPEGGCFEMKDGSYVPLSRRRKDEILKQLELSSK